MADTAGGNLTQNLYELAAIVASAVATEVARHAGMQHLECLPLETPAELHDIPTSTLFLVRQAGKGPPVFHIGRRIYCLRRDWNEWLVGLAATGGVKHLNSPRRPPPQADAR